MSKFKVKLKITGLEFEVEGSREDASSLAAAVGSQFATLLQPAGLAEQTPAVKTIEHMPETPRSQKRRSRKVASTAADDLEAEVIEFRHDPEAQGVPTQGWKTAEKAMWLISVLKEVAGRDSFSTRTIVATFNKQFKQAGTVTTSNVTRDLGKAKTVRPALVGEDTTKSPSEWFLTDEGKRRVAQLLTPEAAA